VGVKVEAEDMLTGKRRYCCHSYLTFVALDGIGGSPTPVPPLVPETPEEIRRFENADRRRQARINGRKNVKPDQFIELPEFKKLKMEPSTNSETSSSKGSKSNDMAIHQNHKNGIDKNKHPRCLSPKHVSESYTELAEVVMVSQISD